MTVNVPETVTNGTFCVCITFPVRYSYDASTSFNISICDVSRSQWPSGLRRGSAADRLRGLRVRIPPRASMSFVLCVVRYRSLWQGDSSSRESYRLLRVVVCDPETSRMRRHWPALGCCDREKKFTVKDKYVAPLSALLTVKNFHWHCWIGNGESYGTTTTTTITTTTLLLLLHETEAFLRS